MIWSIEFLEEAEKDMKKLDHSAQIQVLKGIKKVSQNPLSVREGGTVAFRAGSGKERESGYRAEISFVAVYLHLRPRSV